MKLAARRAVLCFSLVSSCTRPPPNKIALFCVGCSFVAAPGTERSISSDEAYGGEFPRVYKIIRQGGGIGKNT